MILALFMIYIIYYFISFLRIFSIKHLIIIPLMNILIINHYKFNHIFDLLLYQIIFHFYINLLFDIIIKLPFIQLITYY